MFSAVRLFFFPSREGGTRLPWWTQATMAEARERLVHHQHYLLILPTSTAPPASPARLSLCFFFSFKAYPVPRFCSARDKMYKLWVVDKVDSSARGGSSIIFHMSKGNWWEPSGAPCQLFFFLREGGEIQRIGKNTAADLYLTFFFFTF